MSLEFLSDENVPAGIIRFLKEEGYTVHCVSSGRGDQEIAKCAKENQFILLTLDSDFSNVLNYPPDLYFGIVRIKIAPPFIQTIQQSFRNLFETFSTPEEFQGKLIILEEDTFRVWEDD